MAAVRNKEDENGHSFLSSGTKIALIFYPAEPLERYIESVGYTGQTYFAPPEFKDDTKTYDFAKDLKAFPKPKVTIVSARLMLKLYEFNKPFGNPSGMKVYFDHHITSHKSLQPRVTRDMAVFNVPERSKSAVICFLRSHQYYYLYKERPNLMRFNFPDTLQGLRFFIDGIKIGGDLFTSGMSSAELDKSDTAQTLFNSLRKKRIISRPFRHMFPQAKGGTNNSFCQLIFLDFSEMSISNQSQLQVETIFNQGLSPDQVFVFCTFLVEKALVKRHGVWSSKM